ncbi:MAG: hypothetical protein LBP50_07730, partial [Tannerella sp.]|nr:hypothetical protein [Tannerella sp.]
YSWTLKPDFPPKDTVYYIHWYMETVNTIGSYGTISSYDVKRKRPTPTIVKSDGVASIGAAPFEVTVTFDPAFDPAITPLAENMFIVSGGNIVPGSLTQVTPGEVYKLTVQSSNANNVTIRFPENRVTDAYGNRNAASIAPYTTLPFSNGLPLADFSSYTDSVYFAAPPFVKFRVTSGNPDARLYRNDGSPVDNVNAAPAVEVTKDGASFSLTSVGFVDLDGTNQINEYTLTGAFTEGEYRIHIKGDSITNYVGNGIRDTVYTFRVFDLGLSFSGGTHDFGTLHEGYAPVAPYSVQVINNGSVTATGLSVVLGVGDTAYVMHTGAMTPTLAGGATTPFTIAPKTGLQVDTPTVGNQVFTATVTLMYHDRPVPGATFGVKFEVFKLQAPVAQIDYINETLTGLESGESYSINRETPVGVADDEIIPIAEGWMNGRTSTNEQIDPATGGRSIPQPIVIPLRPAAPAGVSKQDAGEGELNNGEILGVNDLMEYRLMPSETWIPVPAGNRALADLVPGTYQVRYKAIVDQAFSSHILTVVIQTQTIQRIEREILLPGMQGVTTLPLPGFHYVHSGEDFTFTLLFTGEPPKVKTSRIVEGVQEELTGVPDGAGGYTYTIRQVRESISVLFETGPVGNASVDGRAVWANAGQICIRTLHPEAADIHTVTGALFKRIRTAEGAEVSVPAAGGVYLIRFANGEVHKVIVR